MVLTFGVCCRKVAMISISIMKSFAIGCAQFSGCFNRKNETYLQYIAAELILNKENSLRYKGGNVLNTYLIDYENVKLAGLKGIESLQSDDVVFLFYSENANTLTFSMHKKINLCPAQFNLTEVKTGKANALDFQLVTYLGYLIAMAPKNNYYVVSQDKGFKSACTFWKDRGLNVSLVSDLTGRDEDKVESQLAKDVRSVVPDKVVADKVTRIITKYKTKQGINNALVREFPSQGNKKASELYKAVKPLLKDKKGK